MCLSPAVQIKMEKQRLVFEKELSSSERLIAHPFPINFYQSLINELSATNIHLVNDVGEQRDFACKDISDGTPFCNETDKGYRCTEAAHRAGKQKMLQPDFARADQHFKGKQVLTSGAIATDRSGNERAFRLSKQSGYINRGIKPAGSPLRMDNAWLAWSFQCNFMFENVL